LGLGALLLWGLVTTASGQVTGQIVQQFFVPFPEADFKTSLQAIAAGNPTGNGISNQIMTTISIVVGTSNTIIVYDHWEDGYENDLNNPTQPSTLIWGNGNTNTPAPGYPSNILPPGAVITLTNVVTLPRNPSVVQYDGRDRIGATRPVTVTRAGWATNIGTLMATATEVYDTTRYGTSFIIPVGTNTTPTIQNFSYSSLHIIAAQDNTVVKVDVNGDGIVDLTNTLNMGESMFVNGGVLCGATVTANNPVQVHELTGRISSDYQSRTFAIRPVSQWDTNYYAPVGTTTENYAHNVFVFNQFRTNLTVLYSTMATNGSFTVSNYTTYKFPMPLNSGARFYTTNGAAFYAVGCDDTGSSNPDDNQDYDWGYALLPAAALTPVAIVGWAPGSDFTSGAPANGSPVWVTPTKATTIYVNYSGNYNSGPLIAPNGNHYDTNFTLVAYQFQTIFNPTTKNMTGARIFTVDGTTFAAAWGEDPAVAGSGLPYMDAGTGIIPFPQPTMSKSSQLVVDVNGNGKPGWGDTMEYTIQVQNLGMLVLGNVLVLDALPNTVTYVTNSTTLNGVPVADNLVPPAATAFPLDESGLVLPEIQVDGYSTLTYRVVINSGATSISNAVLGSAGDQPVTSTESFLVAGPVTLAFTDASGNPVSSYVTNSGIYISLIDLIQNTNASTAQTVTVTVSNVTGGDVESLVLTETGTNTGIFRNTTPLPMSTTAGTNKNDGTLHALAGNFLLVSYTDPISGVSGSATVTVTASPMPYVTKSSLLVVDLNGNSLIGWGDTVQYSILLTNTTAQAITNLVVLDTLPANVSYVTNSTASNGVAVADSGATPFPLDEAGLSVRSLAASNSTLVTFRVTVNSGTSISNSVTVTNLNGLVQAQNVASVTPPPPSCNLNFTDGSGNPVTTCVQNAGLYVTMTDNSQNTSPTNAQTVTVTITNVSGGDVESLTLTETGTNTGVFRNTTALPTSTIFGTAQQDGTLNGSAGQVITVYFAGAGGETCSASATFVPAVQTKKLYLSAVNASNLYQSLNRINPVAAGATSTSNSVALTNGSNATFVQTPVFCQPFVLSADSPVAVTNYVSILSGSMPASPAIRAMLMQGTNAATATNILTLTNAAYSGGLLGWSGTLSSNVTVGAGETTFLVITSAQSGASFSIQYNSASKPSAISLPTTTVISLEQLGVYDAPYPGGNLVTNAVNAQTIYIRGTASDPFGAYDVTKISLYLLDPGGYAFTTNLTGAYLVASNACSSTYEYPWVTENWQGSYSVLATAYEGTEGITNALQTVFQAHYPSGGTPSTTTFIDSSGNPTNSYATNQTVCVQVQNPDANQNPAAVETVSVVITTTSGDRETVTLTETGTNTGVFTGCITANTGAAVPGNGVLNAPGGSGLIATYTDALFPSNTSSNSAIVRLPPGPQPVVSLFKTLVAPANSTVLLGSTVQFNLEVANPGSVTVTNVTLTDTFPSNRLQFVSATIPANSSTPAGTLTWTNLGPLTPGTNLIISAFFTAKMAGALTNSATVTGTTNVGPVTAMATNNVSAIAVTKTLVSPIPGPAYINSNVVFQIAIANTGVKAITSYQLQDLFSSACFQFLGASVPPSGSGGGVVLWSSMPALAVGASTNIYVTNKVIGDCEPAVNNANISSVVDQSGDSVPNAQSSASITNLGASISGLVWYDANANGTNDAGDSPLASVNVYVDLNGDGVRQGNEPYATTDTNGLYEIVSIPAGSYAVRVDTNSLPAGVRPTYDLDGTNTPNTVSLIISNGQVFTNLNFGYVGSGSISGYIWNDLNGDGVLEAGEPGLSGVTVFIDLNANGVRDAGEPYIASAPDGSFAFDYLVANTYRVAVDILSLPPNMRPTFDLDGTNTPNVATITLGAGQNVTNANFGYQGRASLTGLITDTSTGFPVTGATVVVVDSLGNTQTVTTSVSGTYSVPSLWTGPAIVTVGKTGYGSAGANPTIAGGANTQNLSLTPNTLAGVVTNTLSGQAIAGATVLVVDSASVTNTLTSDASGHYTLTNIAAGVATVTASESGYLTSSASPTIVAGANTQNLGLTPNTLAGVVTDAITTLPIAGATVVVTDSSNIVHTITTDGAGHYGVTNLPTGLATVSASKTGYGSSGSSPTIVAGANTQNLMLTANTLAGVVTNTLNGQPIVGATVLVVDSASVTNTLTTDVSGHYGVTNIAAGIATITASQSGYVTASVSPTIVAGANTQDLGLTPNTLTGLVTDAVTTLPIVGASVAVTDSSNAVHAVTTDATGHYSVTVLPTGPASVTASQIGYGSAGANPTIIAGANIQNLSLTANTLVGVITNTATGLPISAAAVQVVDSANVTNTIATDSNGHYGVTNIAAGIITITASQSGYVAASASPTIVTGANAQDLGLTPNSLTGLVTDAVTMLPIAGATVAVTDSSNAVHTVTTDATGHYSVTVLPTGPATVTASQIGYGSAGANPTIVAGANIQNLSLTANTLTGIITDSLSGLPIAGASVAVIDSAGVNTSIVTGPSGAYSVSGIAAGAASVTANMVGYSSANASPVISAGANTQDLKLTPNILTGHVTDAASQQPLAGVLVQVIDGAGTTNTITTDATGYYGVTNIAPGVATVTASKSGYNTATATPTIVAGPNTQDLQLSVSNPTLALLSSIKAYLAGDGVLVRWQTASEAGSVSFDLYRQNPAGGNWVKVNAAPVLAANSPTGSTYDVADPDAKPAETLAYRLVELEEQGTTRTYGPFGLHADAPTPAAPPKALVTETASPLAKAALVRSPQSLTQTSSAPLSTLDGSRFIKIITTNSGIQNVTATALGIALGQAPANIQSAILARSLLLSNQGQPVAYVASADGSALSFYAEPLKNNYTAQNVYSLTFAPGLPLGTVLSPPTTPVPAARLAYLAELDLEQDLLAVPSLVQDPSQDFWMWQRLVAGIPMFNTAAFSFALDHLSVSGSGTASLTLHLLGGDQATHTVQVTLNGSLVGQDTWQGCTPHDTVLQIPSSLLIEGANQLSLQAVATAGSATSQWYVNSFGLNYPRQYFAVNGTLLFNANSNMVITVDGFTSPAITVLEISDPNQPALVQNLTIAPTDAGYSASFAPADPQNQFVAFQSGAGTTPASVACAQTANLSRAANAADYIIIAPDSLTAPAGQLAAYRQRKGLRPVVVSLDQVYDEFSSGIITPEAIRQFLRTALTNWVVKPRYVVLIGNGTYDYRDLLQQHDNLMPPLLVNTSYGLFCSDSAYGDLNGDGQPEIAVGRLPVKTAQQLLALIGKIQSYEALPQTAPAQALLVADAPDSAGDFTAAIQQVSTTLVGSYSNTVVQGAGQSNLGPVRQAIQSSLNAGVDLVDYIGHGAIDRFGNYGYLTSADVAALQNGARLPVVVAVTCVAGQYSVPGSDCLAGYLSMQNAGGAIAVVAPTGLSVDQDASRLNLRLLNLLRANTGPGLGDMFRQALADHVALDNPTTQPAIYNLIGDPALAYNVAVQASTAAPQFTGASVTNGVLVITWSGGQPPYQLEQTTTLGPKASWQAVGSPVSGFTTTLPVTGPMGFIRVRCSR